VGGCLDRLGQQLHGARCLGRLKLLVTTQPTNTAPHQPTPPQRVKLRPELNTVAVGRLGCYLPRGSPSVAILSSAEVAEALTQVGGCLGGRF
jgi:hypothetical protein